METTLIAGTDGANVALFDPAALPVDINEKLAADFEVMVELQKSGRIVWPCADGDGDWILRLFVDEPIPDGIEFIDKAEHESVPEFHVPSGELWFVGAEYLGVGDELRKKWVNMGESVRVPAGVYRVELRYVLHQNLASERRAKWVAEVGRAGVLLYKITFCAGCLGVLGLVSSIGILAYSLWGGMYLAIAAASLLVLAFGASKGRTYRKVGEAELRSRRNCPHFVASMTMNRNSQ